MDQLFNLSVCTGEWVTPLVSNQVFGECGSVLGMHRSWGGRGGGGEGVVIAFHNSCPAVNSNHHHFTVLSLHN
jgi:hypothetical protein